MSNPFSAEKRQAMQDDAQEFLTSFGLQYAKLYSACLLDKIEKDVSDKTKNLKKLKYRAWEQVERPELFCGPVFMKVGGGPGGFSKFKPCYIVERKDYNIDVYATKKDYDAKKKPKHTIMVAGLILERDPSDHYYKVLHALASGLGISEEQLRSKTTFSKHAWALSHQWRTNYIFQLHKVKESGGCCGGGNTVEPEGAGSEEAKDRDMYVKAFDMCTRKAKPRNTKEVKAQAFERTAKRMTVLHERLYEFEDEGTESQILTDMLLQQVFTPMRDDLINGLKGPVGMRLTVWFKMRVAIQETLQKMVDPAIDGMFKTADTIQAKVEPAIKGAVEPIVTAKQSIKEKIRNSVNEHTAKFLTSHVSPFMQPIMKALEEPLKKAFDQQRKIYVDKIPAIESLPDDEKQRNKQLDAIPRQKDILKEMTAATNELIEPLKKLTNIHESLFVNLDPYKYRQECEDNLLETLDAAVNTLEKKIKEDGKKNELKDEILDLFDDDAKLARAEFVKDVLQDLLLGGLFRALSPLTDPILGTLDDLIPEAMSDYLSIQALYEEMVELIIGEPIAKMVDAAYG